MRFLAAILLLLCSGCASPRMAPRTYVLRSPVRVVVMDKRDMDDFSKTIFGKPVRAFCYPNERIAYVAYGDGELPDFFALGHELFHLPPPEGGGHYHP